MHKYMNNHFGTSRIFSKARFKTADDSVEMGDIGGSTAGSGGGGSSADNQDDSIGQDSNKPTNEELLERIAQSEIRIKQIEAEAERQKLENNRLSAEKEKLKTQLTAKMTAEEQIDEAKKEAEEAKNKRLEEMESELEIIKATKRYMTLKMDEKGAEEIAKLEISGDMENVIKILGKHIMEIEKTAAENAISKFLADRPDIKAGNGDATKNSVARDKAVSIAKRNLGANQDILKHYISGGKK